ncbi:MAG TPA: EI24 domain-containing protein [Stellaceae bacterium]|nr:EI24 domain-containing protein [Stellaceae bacterium]
MLAALVRAIADLSAPPLRRVVALCLALAVLSFIALWLVVAMALNAGVHFAWRPLDWLVQLVGGAGVLGLSWLLFPAVVTLIMGFFLDRIAAEIEALDYPGSAAPRRTPMREVISLTLRLMIVTIVVNILALPVYVLAPGVNFFVFLCLNGYLFGRQYFEVVALRRLDMAAIQAVRHRFGWRIFVGGVVITGLFAVPFVNLLAPVIATAFMIHLYARLARLDPQAFAA